MFIGSAFRGAPAHARVHRQLGEQSTDFARRDASWWCAADDGSSVHAGVGTTSPSTVSRAWLSASEDDHAHLVTHVRCRGEATPSRGEFSFVLDLILNGPDCARPC